MMPNKKLSALCILMLIVLLFGCQANNDTKNQNTSSQNDNNVEQYNGLKYDIVGVPFAYEFSNSKYDDDEYYFPPIKSAVLRNKDTEETISNDDPRLIQLLNFLSESNKRQQTIWLQGYVEENEINNYLSSDQIMLEVCFHHEKGFSDSLVGKTPKIVVCGDSYIAIVDPKIVNNGKDGLFAERFWPYGTLLQNSDIYGFEKNMISEGNEWGNCYWLDILKHCGFITE